MFDITLASRNVPNITRSHFFHAVSVYVFKPHVVNRKLFGINNVLTFAFRQIEQQDHIFDVASALNNYKLSYLKSKNPETIVAELAQKYCLEVEPISNVIDVNTLDEDRGHFILNRMLPRNLNAFRPLDMLVITDPVTPSVSFLCLNDNDNCLAPKIAFSIQMEDQLLSMKCCAEPAPDSKSMIWLREVLFQRLLKWIDNFTKQESQAISKDVQSLSLLHNLEEYNQLYGKLKTKYGTKMVEQWPEGTDPKKYVYEDVAIAAYLLLLWKQEREFNRCDRLQSFVDLGCGNGLLVYILASEGHDGIGIDLRKRKIWDLYTDKIKLIEKSFIPSDAELFPQTDWIIGNHSDELSPWIPVLAARSSYSCRYFLLPCCAFEFNGSKFQRTNSGVSQYNDFLSYVKQISNVCGFKTLIDRLKIPSTKRTCVVGASRLYSKDQFDIYYNNIQTFIDNRSNSRRNEDNWLANFKPRECIEKVRNCTKIDRSVVDEIVAIVFNALIAKKRIACEFPGKNWNAGGVIAIGELVNIIDQHKLNHLKSECGGLQTLLKNNHQVFQVMSGYVQLRIPTKHGQSSGTVEELMKKTKRKKMRVVNLKEKPCWYFGNHPDGCPFDEYDCKFKH